MNERSTGPGTHRGSQQSGTGSRGRRASHSNGRRATAVRLDVRALLRNWRLLAALAAALAVLILVIVNAAVRGGLERRVEELEAAVSQLEREKTELETDLRLQSGLADVAQDSLDGTVRAMDLFWQINEAYVVGRQERARELIRTLESETLASYLPSTSTTDNGRFSPYDRYAEICEAMGETYGAGVKAAGTSEDGAE